MTSRSNLKTAGQGLAIGAGIAALGYAGLIAYHRARYGKGIAPEGRFDDSRLLDRFIPAPEVTEHHQVRIAAPPDVVMTTARSLELLNQPLVRAVIKLRELAMGAEKDVRRHPAALLPQMESIGWVVLAERAGREIVLGAVTKPWQSDVAFRSIPSAAFAEFREPGYVKIAWTLRADPIGANETMFHTETRVATTDHAARKLFRRYWSFVAPGVAIIRLAMLRPLKKAAEHRAGRAAA
jgi:hypothetical protein